MNDSPLQNLVDAMGDAAQTERSKYHLTLGELIDFLKGVDDTTKVVVFDNDDSTSPSSPHSYRGYYEDLGLEPTDEQVTANKLLAKLLGVHESHLTGYKGGEFLMDDSTPLWMAEWGSAVDSRPIMDVSHEGENIVLELGEKD